MDKLTFQAQKVLVSSKDSIASVGAISILKACGDRQGTLIWNYVLTELSAGRMPHYEQLHMKYFSQPEEIQFWAISADGDLIKGSQTAPNSFYALDREAAILYAQQILEVDVR
jgi:hypothetical protein